ncbi:MAG TPA: 50S ribosomal protein L29 [Patescibacteria group bacterium]|nr:50S ribosomal protein L29 [Patescibacteria group bacterium]
MKIKELRKKSKNELKNLLNEQKEGLRELRFGVSLKQSKNVRKIRNIKKNIARILTILKQNNN